MIPRFQFLVSARTTIRVRMLNNRDSHDEVVASRARSCCQSIRWVSRTERRGHQALAAATHSVNLLGSQSPPLQSHSSDSAF